MKRPCITKGPNLSYPLTCRDTYMEKLGERSFTVSYRWYFKTKHINCKNEISYIISVEYTVKLLICYKVFHDLTMTLHSNYSSWKDEESGENRASAQYHQCHALHFCINAITIQVNTLYFQFLYIIPSYIPTWQMST